MNPKRHKSKRGFTLVEVLIAVVIVAVLGAFIVPRVLDQVKKAQQAEAIGNLGAIRSAELLLQNLNGKFMAAADELGIQSVLGLWIEGRFYKYKIIDATEENFLAIATPIEALTSWLEGIAIDKNGFVNYPSSYGGSSSSGGGSSGGSSGGSTWTTTVSGVTTGTMGGGGGVVTIYSGTMYQLQNAPVPDIFLSAPTNLTLVPNDGWLVISFADLINPDVTGYQIEKAEKIGNQVGEWGYPEIIGAQVTPNWSWEDQVENGKTYCYRVTTIVEYTNGSSKKSEPSSVVCEEAAPNAAFTAKINGGKTDLDAIAAFPDPSEGAPSGQVIVDFLNNPDGDPLTNDAIPVLFGDIQDGSLAYQDPATGALVLDRSYLDVPDEFIAALLAHEGLHAIWDADWNRYEADLIARPAYGNNPDGTIRNAYSYYNEYSAFTTDAEAWNQMKANVTYNTLNSVGKGLYDDMDAGVNYFLDNSGNRISFPSGVPPNGPVDPVTHQRLVDPATGLPLNVLQILQTVYGYASRIPASNVY